MHCLIKPIEATEAAFSALVWMYVNKTTGGSNMTVSSLTHQPQPLYARQSSRPCGPQRMKCWLDMYDYLLDDVPPPPPLTGYGNHIVNVVRSD